MWVFQFFGLALNYKLTGKKIYKVTLGPAKCPIAGCTKVLRKVRFKKQTFEDIQIEREVDIRKRVNKMYALLTLRRTIFLTFPI